MEIGRTSELVVLTPGDTHWVERALDALGGRGDGLAREVLKQGTGRALECSGNGSGKRCKAAARRWSRTDEGRLRAYCLEHWREMDPNDTLGLNDEDRQ